VTMPAQDRDEWLTARATDDGRTLGTPPPIPPMSDWKRRLLYTSPGSPEEAAVLAERPIVPAPPASTTPTGDARP